MLRGLDPTLAATGPFLQQLNPILRFLELNQVKASDFFAIGPAALGGIRSTPAKQQEQRPRAAAERAAGSAGWGAERRLSRWSWPCGRRTAAMRTMGSEAVEASSLEGVGSGVGRDRMNK